MTNKLERMENTANDILKDEKYMVPLQDGSTLEYDPTEIESISEVVPNKMWPDYPQVRFEALVNKDFRLIDAKCIDGTVMKDGKPQPSRYAVMLCRAMGLKYPKVTVKGVDYPAGEVNGFFTTLTGGKAIIDRVERFLKLPVRKATAVKLVTVTPQVSVKGQSPYYDFA